MNPSYIFKVTGRTGTSYQAGILQFLKKLFIVTSILFSTLTLSAQYTYNDFSGTFDDGSGAAQYTDNYTGSYLIQPAGASTITLSFTSFDTEAYFDFVYVYGGADANATLIGKYDNNNLPPATITINSQSLFILFTTDGSVTKNGWTVQYSGILSGSGSGSNTFSTLYPDRDSGILNSTQPGSEGFASTNYSYPTTMMAEAGTSSSYNYTWRCYIGLDLSSLPANATITSAKLYLYSDGKQKNATTMGTGYQSNACLLKRTTAPWSPSTITWNNIPSATTDNEVTLASSVSISQDYVTDITQLVKDMQANPTQGNGMLMRLQSEVNYCTMSFYSSEYSDQAKRPKLELTYTSEGIRQTLTVSNNFIYSVTPQVALSDLTSANTDDVIEEIVYFDGLGRPMQNVSIQASPGGKDIVTPIRYDAVGRENKRYLPYALTTASTGAFVENDIVGQNSYYSGIYGTTDGSSAFAKTDFEPSPLNRVFKQGAPGAVWQPNVDAASDHSIKLAYSTNSATDNVRLWTISGSSPVSTTTYSVNSLYKTTTWDENNNSTADVNRTEEFKDKQGKVVLKRSKNGAEILSTYYVYDDFELLRFVIPPLANGDGGNVADNNVISELCYQYTYDSHKRMVEKKLPGVGWTYLVYDLRDRLVATQDPEMRNLGRWLVTKYDQLNRPVMTASIVLSDDHNILQTYFNTYSSSYFESRDASSIGYTMGGSFNPKLNLTESDLLTVIYYDTYGYPGVKIFDNSVRVSNYSDGDTTPYYFDGTKGLVTGSRVKVLDGTENNAYGFRWMVSTNYYDDRYRVIQTLRDLYSTTATDNEVVSILYDFPGKVMKTQTKQVFLGNTNTVIETSTYDHAGRLTQVKHNVNNAATDVTLASLEYDEIGQLKQKSLNGEVGSGIQNLNYFYNIRGWLEKINDPETNPLSSSTQKLNLGLYYNNVPSGLSASAQLNGNISGLVWNTPEQSGALSPNAKQGYSFTYDGLNRMRTSTYGEGATFAANVNANNENVDYDLNGNIITLTRFKKGIGPIDNLTYTYKNSGASNMLDRVDDAITGAEGFSDNNIKQANEYGYDGNGNLISDANKGYDEISYNYLNLPRQVGTTGQFISYVYDAAGTKLAKINTGGAYTYYAGSFVYSGSSLKYIIHSEGMYLPGGNYQYYLKDHLGNTRLVVNTSGTGGEIVQQTDYYPFGMDIANYNYGNVNKYRYNGKEFQDDLINGKNLDWYDYGARFYDSQIGRWHTVDPMAESYYSQSPFHFAGNNPMLFLDANGMDYWSTNDPDEIARFFRGMQSGEGGFQSFDYNGWNHSTDAEFTGNLTYNDKSNMFYSSYGTVRNDEATRVGISISGIINSDTGNAGFLSEAGASWLGRSSGAIESSYPIENLLIGGAVAKPITFLGGRLLSGIFGRFAAKGVSVIGPRATYREFAKKAGANFLNVTDEAWTMRKNVEFLQGVVKRGDDVIFSGKYNPLKLDPNSVLGQEIRYLQRHGYSWTDDFSRMIKK